jgi:predicted molibdopterin-dependent oxidoreductase YjgC
MRLQRLAETDRPAVSFTLDGAPMAALEGDSLLTAILAQDGGCYLRASEFGDGLRAGFCLMGACQDCWVNVEGGGRVRACTTPIAEGMRVSRGMVRP